MTEPTPTTEILGKEGEPCRECGAPLAADQRYCLNCGRRRSEPRVDFQNHVPVTSTGANGAGPTSAHGPAGEAQPAGEVQSQLPAEKPQRDYTPLAAVGGIAVLGIMLLIGVLIGKGDNGGTTAAPAPVIVGGGETSTEKNASEEEGGEAKAEAKQAKAKAGKGGAVKGGSADTGNAPVAGSQQLEELQEGTPEEKAERSANLPDEIATEGPAPPKDNKAPGGGSKGTAIE